MHLSVPALGQLEAHIGTVVLGKQAAVRMCLVGLLAGEHVLLEDVPGVGKTLIAKALAKCIQGRFARIQFTPDLLPSDIVGGSVYLATQNEFQFHPGPIFANLILADEINRTTPRTQSALLEAMSEGQVTVDGHTHALPRPFLVIATQNPFEFEGTYPLPESQLDRFLLRVSVGYPPADEELALLAMPRHGDPVDQLRPMLTCDQVLELATAVREVRLEPALAGWLLEIVAATRSSPDLHVGVSTRGLLAWQRACQAWALLAGRDYVTPDDIKQLAVPVLAHRVIPRGYQHGARRDAVESLIARLIEGIPAPR